MNREQVNQLANGWGLFETDDGPRIQRDDESGRFASDSNALEYLVESADAGNKLHAAALAHHYASIAGLEVVSVARLAEEFGLPEDVVSYALRNLGNPSDS